MEKDYKTFWGDTHHNTYMGYRQDPTLADVMKYASTNMDFYTGAYYTPVFSNAPLLPEYRMAPGPSAAGHPSEQIPGDIKWHGVGLEGLKDPAKMAKEWAEFEDVTRQWNRPGEFVAFPGYEWQGNGRWGDHNVVYLKEGHPIHTPEHLADLYEILKDLDAIAIPHHTGYNAPHRAPTWSACNDKISLFAELFSVHGCSETDEERPGLRSNSHMGPGVGGATYQDALDLGLHIGAICSTDNWKNVPCWWGQGNAACLAKELTRESLWEAFQARRVYGVTGDRMELEFTCNGEPMGRILPHMDKREIRISVKGLDAIDRIELLRNGEVIATHSHQGTWKFPEPGKKARFKWRIEAGWGPKPGGIPIPDQHWKGEFTVSGGRVTGWKPCWIARGQGVPRISRDTVHFEMLSRQENIPGPTQGANVFEFEADPDATVTLKLNSQQVTDTIRNFGQKSRLLWYRDECVDLVKRATGVTPETARRGDVYYHVACKSKLHRLIPEAGYTAALNITDTEPLRKETHYRVRVEQRNGQRAWSSPIWVAGKG